MLIIALVLALIGLAALVFAVVTSNQLVAWVCIGASVLGVVLLIIDALRERRRRSSAGDGGEADDEDRAAHSGEAEDAYVDYPEEAPDEGEQGQGEQAVTGDTAVDEASGETGTQEADETQESAVSGDRGGDDRPG